MMDVRLACPRFVSYSVRFVDLLELMQYCTVGDRFQLGSWPGQVAQYNDALMLFWPLIGEVEILNSCFTWSI